MYRRKITYFGLVLLGICIFVGKPIHAQTQISTETINAEILSSVWYSSTTINAKDSISIYAGFQNHSGKNLSGVAGFYVDDVEIKRENFTANAKSLIKLETKYTTTGGRHKAQVKILEINSTETGLDTNNLMTKETEVDEFYVKQDTSKEALLDKATDTAVIVVDTIDKYTDKLANYIEGFKDLEETPATSTSAITNISSPTLNTSSPKGQVLGTSTENISTPSQSSLKDKAIDALAYVVRQWEWILGLVFLYMVYNIFKRD